MTDESMGQETSLLSAARHPRANDGPVSLYAPDDQGFLSKDQCKALLDQIVGYATGGGITHISVETTAERGAEWALNRTRFTSDVRGTRLDIMRNVNGAVGFFSTTRLDEQGLRHAVRCAEQLAKVGSESPEDRPDVFVQDPTLNPVLWSDETSEIDAGGCTEIAQKLIAPTEDAGMLSTGQLKLISAGTAALSTEGLLQYYKTTEARCSMTVRNKEGTASGWAGMNHYDLAKISPDKLAAKALDKAQRSANPVAVEPGRYTTILEPQAMSDLWCLMMQLRGPIDPLDRMVAERPSGPFGKAPGLSKITEQVLDSRVIARSDPMDPDGAFIPFDWGGTPFQAVNWIDQGILKQLAYPKGYALAVLGLDKALPKPDGYRLTAAPGVTTSTIDEMIAKTERGVIVTRLSGVRLVDFTSMLLTGYTRDGLWLIERGKITKAIKNFRFNESPLFILNNLEDIGTPERVYSDDGYAYVAPPVRVRDFSFTSLADAI